MTTADELMDEVEALLNGLDPNLLSRLRQHKGYAYEAFVFVALADTFVAEDGWHWVHPPAGPMLTTTRGGRIADSLYELSNVTNGEAELSLVQSVEWRGISRQRHALDIALIGHRDWLHYAPRFCLHGLVECKNHGQRLSMPEGRNMVALRAETKYPGCHFERSQWTGVTALVSASECSRFARDLMAFYQVRTHAPVTPDAPRTWAKDLVSEFTV